MKVVLLFMQILLTVLTLVGLAILWAYSGGAR